MSMDVMSVQQWRGMTRHPSQIRAIGHQDLQALENVLVQYHGVAKSQIEQRIQALNALVLAARGYAQNKNTAGVLPHQRNRRTRKKEVAELLAEQAQAVVEYLARVLAAERTMPAMFGKYAQTPVQAADTPAAKWKAAVKQLQAVQGYVGTPAEGRVLRADYWTEAVDPLHRNWHHPVNNKVFAEWAKRRHLDQSTDLSFYRWLETLSDDDVGALLEGDERIVSTDYQDLAGRGEHRVFVAGDGRLRRLAGPDNMVLFDTGEYHTNFFGPGWCIFVISPERELYCNNHDDSIGWFHAAFLGGKPVIAAGEMFIRNGVLHAITPKSGHYQPTTADMVRGLEALDRAGVELKDTQIMEFKWKQGGGMYTFSKMKTYKIIRWFDALQYMNSGGLQGLLREEAAERAERFMYDPSRPKQSQWFKIQGDEWLDKRRFEGLLIPPEFQV